MIHACMHVCCTCRGGDAEPRAGVLRVIDEAKEAGIKVGRAEGAHCKVYHVYGLGFGFALF